MRKVKYSADFKNIISLVVFSMLFISSQVYAISGQILDATGFFDHHQSDSIQSLGNKNKQQSQVYLAALEAYENNDMVLAKRILHSLAEQGHTQAAFRLGMMYDIGEGTSRDNVLAARFYKAAADNGHNMAQHNLGVAYANGDGVQLDIKQALGWWQRAALQGNTDSQYNLGIIYAMGIHGVKKNLNKAKKWWRRAAINGDALAQYNLGTLYANAKGEGGVRSYCEAMRWWEKSARNGVKQAVWALQVIKTRKDYVACW